MVFGRAVGVEGAPVALGCGHQVVVRILFRGTDLHVEVRVRLLQRLEIQQPAFLHIADQHGLGLGDARVLHLEPEHVDVLRAIGVVDHGLGAGVAPARVGDVDARLHRGRLVPEQFACRHDVVVQGEFRARGKRRLRRIIGDQAGDVGVDDAGQAGAVAGGGYIALVLRHGCGCGQQCQ